MDTQDYFSSSNIWDAQHYSNSSKFFYMIKLEKDKSRIQEFLSKCSLTNPADQLCQPLFSAVSLNRDIEVIDMLIKAGADVNKKYYIRTGDCMGTLLMNTKCSNILSINNCISKNVIDFIISKNFNLKAVCIKKNTIIHNVNCRYLIDLAIRHGVCIDAKNNRGLTPLKDAIVKKNYLKAKYLLELGANPNCLEVLLGKLQHEPCLSKMHSIINLMLFHGASDVEYFYKKICELLHLKSLANIIYNYITYIVRHYLLYVNENGLDHVVVEEDYQSQYVKNEKAKSMIPSVFFKKLLMDCKLELEEMRAAVIKDGLTFYEFLLLKKVYSDKLVDISFDEYRYTNKQIQEIFPIYSELIIMRIDHNKHQMCENNIKNSLERIILRPVSDPESDKELYINYDVMFLISKQLDLEDIRSLLFASIDD